MAYSFPKYSLKAVITLQSHRILLLKCPGNKPANLCCYLKRIKVFQIIDFDSCSFVKPITQHIFLVLLFWARTEARGCSANVAANRQNGNLLLARERSLSIMGPAPSRMIWNLLAPVLTVSAAA